MSQSSQATDHPEMDLILVPPSNAEDQSFIFLHGGDMPEGLVTAKISTTRVSLKCGKWAYEAIAITDAENLKRFQDGCVDNQVLMLFKRDRDSNPFENPDSFRKIRISFE